MLMLGISVISIIFGALNSVWSLGIAFFAFFLAKSADFNLEDQDVKYFSYFGHKKWLSLTLIPS